MRIKGRLSITIVFITTCLCGQELKDPFSKQPNADRPPSVSSRQEAACEVAVSYRDNQLAKDWDRAVSKYDIFNEGRLSVNKLKDEVMNENAWSLTSIPEFALHVKTTCDIIKGVVKMLSPAGNISKLAEKMGTDPGKYDQILQKTLKVIKTGGDIKKLLEEEFGALTWSLVVEVAGPVGAAADLAKNTTENYEKAQKLPGEKVQYKKTIQQQVENLDRQLAKYDATISSLMNDMRAINAVREAIDRECGKSRLSKKNGFDQDEFKKAIAEADQKRKLADPQNKPLDEPKVQSGDSPVVKGGGLDNTSDTETKLTPGEKQRLDLLWEFGQQLSLRRRSDLGYSLGQRYWELESPVFFGSRTKLLEEESFWKFYDAWDDYQKVAGCSDSQGYVVAGEDCAWMRERFRQMIKTHDEYEKIHRARITGVE